MTSQSKLQGLLDEMRGLAVFRGLLELPLFEAALNFGDAPNHMAYGAFVSALYRLGGDLTESVMRAVFEDENIYVISFATGNKCNPHIATAAKRELAILSDFAALTPADFASEMEVDAAAIAGFSSRRVDLGARYAKRVKAIFKYGYGIFASHGMFRLSDSGARRIEPIVSADRIEMDTFIGYEDQRERVVQNTRAFVEGKPAANVLLYGDAGTGKSSTVKAVANQFFDEGVRLIEIRKDQMSLLPFVMEQINHNPLKFIIFIDDLSFNRNDDTFSMLKAALEGSASAKASNAVIYATSNRRHIVRECFDDREGSDVHRNDTMQELLSLSARFGLSIRFEKPNKMLYLEIVRELAKKKGVEKDVTALEIEAEAFALNKGHRSPRCAEQFIDSLL